MHEFGPGVTLVGPHLRTTQAAHDHGVFHVTAVIPLTVSRVATDGARQL